MDLDTSMSDRLADAKFLFHVDRLESTARDEEISLSCDELCDAGGNHESHLSA